MPEFSNLVRDSKIARDIITLFGRGNRELPYARAARETMRIQNHPAEQLRRMFTNLLGADPRFELTETGILLAEDPRERAPLHDLEYCVVDTETTGASPRYGDRLTEIAAVRVRGGVAVDRFSTLVNPTRPIPPMITRLTGITDRMVAGAPRFEDVAPDLLAFIGDAVIVAHNAPFDRAFMNAEFSRAFNRCLLAPFLCTVQLGRRVVPGLASYRLDSLADYFGVRIANRHRALGDAEATSEVFCGLLVHLREFEVTDLRSARKFRAEGARAAHP